MATTPRRGVNDVLDSIRDLNLRDYHTLKAKIVSLDTERDTQIERMRVDLEKQGERLRHLLSRASVEAERSTAASATLMPPVAEAAGAKRKKKVKKTKSAAGKRLFRNPDNKDQTWSGFGPMPAWMKETGKPKEAFLVS